MEKSYKNYSVIISLSNQEHFRIKTGYFFCAILIVVMIYLTLLTKLLNAKAFTNGKDIYIRPKFYNANSFKSKKLSIHELTHILQQGLGLVLWTHDLCQFKQLEKKADCYGILAIAELRLIFARSESQIDDFYNFCEQFWRK